MQKLSVEKIDIFEDAYIINSLMVEDDRGFVVKDYNVDFLKQNKIDFPLKEVFYTVSKKGVIRAIHFQLVNAQEKLVRCLQGKIYDVIVDLRVGSPTYKRHYGIELSKENGKEIFVPSGFGHGYIVLEDSIVSYKCNEVFYGQYDSGIMYNDKDLDIDWKIPKGMNLIISDKDKSLMSLQDYEKDENAFRM